MGKNGIDEINVEYIIANLPGHIYWKDVNGVYLGCNEAQAKSLGLKSPRELIGKTDFDFPCKLQAEIYRKNDIEVMKTGKPKIVEEICFIKDKEVVVLSQKVPLKDKNNKIIGILGVSLDINTCKIEENKLAAGKEFAELTLEHIIAHMPGHVYWKDIKGVYLGCNDKQAKSLGLENGQQVIGKTDFELPWKEQAAKLREADSKVINSCMPITVEEPAALADGSLAIFLSKKEPLRDKNNTIIGVLGVSLDITEIKHYQEKLRQATQAKMEFLQIMSHELTMPLSNIVNTLDLIENALQADDLDKTTLLNYLKLAKNEASLIKPKLTDVGKYLNFDESTIQSYKADCNLVELIENVIAKNQPTKAANVTLNYQVDPTLPKNVLIDTEHLHEVLTIVIANAFKYTRQGSITLRLEPSVENNEKANWVKITVQDTGPGIYAAQLKTILRDFNKELVEESAFKQYRKPSVRLPYAKLLTHHILKGQLTIQTEVGVGTTIVITIPYEATQQTLSAIAAMQQPETFRVLLIEDNDVSRALETQMLLNLNCQVAEAAAGSEALAKAATEPFDLIFLDITLPDMHGLQFFDLLQKTPNANTPVVALTSHTSETDMDIFTSKGMLTVIPKPVTQEALKDFFSAYRKSLEE